VSCLVFQGRTKELHRGPDSIRVWIAERKECLMKTETIGSVMVVGGGIAGMQASLDLANSGYFVHLVEKDSAIGGMMSALDKTFPTNDCAM
jgi:heterodisulfide reductase subunit A